MAVRATMAELIDRVRSMIGDTGTTKTFTDQEVQDALDRYRTDVSYEDLQPQDTIGAGGVTQYLIYFSARGYWEPDALLQDYNWNTLTSATAEWMIGRFTFAVSQLPPVYLTGKSYDVMSAAVDVLEQWAARVKLDYSYSADGQSFNRSQKLAGIQAMLDMYRQRIPSRLVTMSRSDVNQGSF
jgi:hypothetical protein